MPSLFAGLGVLPSLLLGGNPLLSPVGGRVGILAVQGIGHLHPSPTVSQVSLVNRLDLPQMGRMRSVFPGAAAIRWMESVFCGASDAVIPLPHDPVEACGRNPIAVLR